MSRRKRKQDSIYTGASTLSPELANSSEEQRIHKRPRIVHELKYVPFFNQSMSVILRGTIKSKFTTGGKNLQIDLEKLKQSLLQKKRLQNGILQKAAELARNAISHTPGTSGHLTDGAYRTQLENESKVLLINAWHDYVRKEFEAIVEDEKKTTAEQSTVLPSTLASSSTSTTASTSAPELISEPTLQLTESLKQSETVYRTCSVSINKIWRTDISSNIMKVVKDKLKKAMISSSDLQAQFLCILQMMIIVLKRNKFVIQDDTLTLEEGTFNINGLLPTDYVEKNNLNLYFSALPIPVEMTTSFKSDFDLLFTNQHLNSIYSFFSGPRGTSDKSLLSHPLQNLLFKKLVSEGVTRGAYQLPLLSEEAKYVTSTSLTNIENMWATSNIFNKMLDKLLLVLLKLHLASTKADEQAKVLEQLDKSQVRVQYFESLPKSSFFETLLLLLMMAMILPLLRVPVPVILFCEMPLLEGAGNTPSPNQDFTDEVNQTEADTSRSRLNGIKAIIKNLLYSNDSVSLADITKQLHQATTKEIDTIMLITKTLQPYIPDKAYRLSISHQLPFCILANDIFSATGNTKFKCDLFPSPSFAYLNALELNPTSLYQILTKAPESLNIAGYDSFDSVESARSNGAAVLNSIFDLQRISQICNENKLKFANHVKLIPGMKVVRLLGTKEVEAAAQGAPKNTTVTSEILKIEEVKIEGRKSVEVLKEEVKHSEALLVTTQNNLKILLKEDKYKELSTSIKEKRSERKVVIEEDARKRVTEEITRLKTQRYKAHQDITDQRKQVSELKQSMFFKRMAIQHHTKLSKESVSEVEQPSRQPLTINAQKILKTSQCSVHNIDQFGYSGTDNGLVNMSTTVPFTANRYKFHLQLYNKYQVLEEDEIEVEKEDLEYLRLPKKFVINSGDVDVGRGMRKQRKRLERKNKKSKEVKRVTKVETELSKVSLTSCSTIQQFATVEELYRREFASLRKFYSSAGRGRLSRSIEIQKARYNEQDSQPREGFKANDQKQLVQFVGDRGTGVGSTLKGFRRYGGNWLPELRSKRNVVCITNEHNTSQLCVFCFHRLIHPRGKNQRPIKGSFLCINPSCVSVKNGKAATSRDAFFSLAIGISGLSHCLFGVYMPLFSPRKISQFHTDKFRSLSSAFFSEESD